jgi:hypothetical protein
VNDNIDSLLEILFQAKAAQAAAAEMVEETQAALIKIAERDELKTLEGEKIRATVVSSERVVYNERTLKKALGVKLWNAIRTEKVDPSKLKTAMSNGKIDPVIVAQNSQITKSKPYLRLSDAGTTQQPDS